MNNLTLVQGIKCKKCYNGEMALKTADEEIQHRGKGPILVVTLPYYECTSCSFDIVSHELMVKRNAIVKEARRKAEMPGEIDRGNT